MKHFYFLRNFLLLTMAILVFLSCNPLRMQRFDYLHKVAATISTERDTIVNHLNRRMEHVSQQQKENFSDNADALNQTNILQPHIGTGAPKQPGMLKFTYQEIKRITLAHSELRPGQRRSGAMAAQSETLSIWWNLFIFFAMLGLFVVLLWWAIEKKQSGCLASAIAVVAIIVLFFLALGIN